MSTALAWHDKCCGSLQIKCPSNINYLTEKPDLFVLVPKKRWLENVNGLTPCKPADTHPLPHIRTELEPNRTKHPSDGEDRDIYNVDVEVLNIQQLFHFFLLHKLFCMCQMP